MIKLYYKCILTCCISGISVACFAQNNLADSASTQRVIAATVNNYYNAIGDQSRLYNGPEYTFYNPIIKGNPYLNDSPTFETGSVKYDGFEYNGVSILYDLNRDCAVILLSNKISMMRLITERIEWFNVPGHHFVYLNLDRTTGLSPGFYDQLYNGQVELLVKRRKPLLKTSAISGTIDNYFGASNDIYLKKGGVYKSIGSKGSILSVLKDKKKELKQYISSNNISFDDKEQAMVKVAAYYDQLTK
jgi:hypothetical protein